MEKSSDIAARFLASLRGYVAKYQDDWDDYTSAATFAYNCRVH
jgi:hypothetical protein